MWNILISSPTLTYVGFPGCSDGKESACQCRRCGFSPWVGRIPGEGNDNPFQYSCLEFHGQRSPVSDSPWGCKRIRRDWETKRECAHTPTNVHLNIMVSSPCLYAYFSFLHLVNTLLLWFSSVQSLSRVRLSATPWIAARQASLSITNSRSSPRLTSIEVSDAIQPSHPLSSPSPPAPNPSQHQSLFQWVNSSHEVAEVLEFQV